MDAFRTYMVRIAVAAESLFHEISKRFKMRIYDEDIGQGILRHPLQDYDDCFKVDSTGLKRLLASDMKMWHKELGVYGLKS